MQRLSSIGVWKVSNRPFHVFSNALPISGAMLATPASHPNISWVQTAAVYIPRALKYPKSDIHCGPYYSAHSRLCSLWILWPNFWIIPTWSEQSLWSHILLPENALGYAPYCHLFGFTSCFWIIRIVMVHRTTRFYWKYYLFIVYLQNNCKKAFYSVSFP